MTMLQPAPTGSRQSTATPIPVFVAPAAGHSLAEFVAAAGGYVEAGLREFGAILFRGFDAATPERFAAAAQAVSPELIASYGDLPLEGDTDVVYRSTPYPRHLQIHFHNESSHLATWPMKLFFACLLPAAEGGETALADSRRLCATIDPDLLRRFATLGLRYTRNFHPGVDVPWQAFFRTTDRAVVARSCDAAATAHEWLPGDRLRTARLARAVGRHPRTRQVVLFNQVLLHHVAALDPATRESVEAVYEPEDQPRSVTFGDGSPIPDDVVAHLIEAYASLAVPVVWEQGDVLVFDNMLMAHSRWPYAGDRKIVVAMAELGGYG